MKIPSFQEVEGCLRKWFNPTTLIPKKLRGTLMGVVLTTSLAEVCMYKMIKQDIRAGEMPMHIADTCIIIYGIVEMVVAPWISWWGYRRRRTMLIMWVGLVTACMCSWFLIPSSNYRAESAFCDEANKSNDITFTGVSRVSAIRLTMFLVSGLVFLGARVGVWSHGLAYLEEYAPERVPLHYCVLLIGRILALVVGKNIVTMIEKNISIQSTLFLLGVSSNLLQLHLLIPKDDPEVKGVLKSPPPMNDRSFSHSVVRVMSNRLVVAQLLAMALLAASLYGYAFHKLDIIKVNYNIEFKRSSYTRFAEIVQYIFVILVVLFAGLHLSSPIQLKFCPMKALKQAIMMSALAFILYVLLMTVPTCDKGKVAGLKSIYMNPECSRQCGCQPRWQEYSPVCMMDDMTTYLSPCQAGCAGEENINGFSVYVNCTCGAGRASAGACSDSRCGAAYDLHQVLFVVMVAVTMVALSAHGVVVLKSVDARDRAVVLGLGWSAIAFMVNVCTHTYFALLKAYTCSWEQRGRCFLPNALTPTLIGASSAALVFISTTITLGSCLWLRRRNRKRDATHI